MAVVSPYLPQTQTLGFAGGQQMDLLDALLASCQKSSFNPPLPGYGRALQPYFAADPNPPKTPMAGNKQGVKGKGKSRNSKGKLINQSGSSSDEELKSAVSKKRAISPADAFKEQTIKAVYHQKDFGTVWAGPTYGMAPSTLDIPLPSDFLLH